MASCYFCGNPVTLEKIYRTSECDQCGRDLKICLNCRFYDTSAHWECRETIPEPVRDKERANFCDFFSMKTHTAVQRTGPEKKAKEARRAFDNLFGDDG